MKTLLIVLFVVVVLLLAYGNLARIVLNHVSKEKTTMNDTAKFTPGPWKFDDDSGTVGQSKIGGVEVIAVIETPPLSANRWDSETMQANAHLIAAAPEMYEALKALVRATIERDNPREMGVFSGDEEVVAAQAAIAKAEGRS